jgi:hypothetical protein
MLLSLSVVREFETSELIGQGSVWLIYFCSLCGGIRVSQAPALDGIQSEITGTKLGQPKFRPVTL